MLEASSNHFEGIFSTAMWHSEHPKVGQVDHLAATICCLAGQEVLKMSAQSSCDHTMAIIRLLRFFGEELTEDYPPAALGPCTGLFVVFFKFYDFLGRNLGATAHGGLWVVIFFMWSIYCSRYVAPSSFVMSSERARADFPQMDGKRKLQFLRFWERWNWWPLDLKDRWSSILCPTYFVRMKYVSVFYEGEHNDARTNLAIAFTAAMYGAAISNYAKAAFVLCAIRFPESLSCVSDRPCFRCFGVKVERILFDDKGIARGAEAGLVVYVVSPCIVCKASHCG